MMLDTEKKNRKEIIPTGVFFYSSTTLGEHHRKWRFKPTSAPGTGLLLQP
jgi:hypothetical protein